MLSEFLSEEAKEPEHQGIGGEQDESEVIEPLPVPGEKTGDAKDAAAVDLEKERREIVRLKPAMARSTDAAAVTKFNERIRAFQRKSKAFSSTYGEIAGAAGARDSQDGKGIDYDALQKQYDAVRTGIAQEVK